MQSLGLCPTFEIKQLTIEAGPKFFDRVLEKVTAAIAAASKQSQQRNITSYTPTPVR